MNINVENIDGSTPIDDISGLKISWAKNQKDVNRAESENIAVAVSKYLMRSVGNPNLWFNAEFLKKVHKDMLYNVWDYAGIIRKSEKSIGVKSYHINSLMSELCRDVIYWCNNPCELTFIEQSAIIHHRLVYIHPFENGNGRFARLISDMYLKAWKCEFPNWPSSIQNDGEIRKYYIESLKLADKGDYGELVNLMLKFGAKEPALSEILGHTFYKQNFRGARLKSIVKAYINKGYNVNETINNGHHPLQLAIRYGMEDIVKLLISAGADINFKDKSGFTSFEIAIIKGQFRIAKMIYDNGYEYTPNRTPKGKLLQHYANFYQFDRMILK